MSGVRVLLVEDEAPHAELARRAFEQAGAGRFRVSLAKTLAEARCELGSPEPPQIVIADWRLPDGEGIGLLRRECEPEGPPLVIMTSHGSERLAVEAMRAGAVDYVVKSETALLELPRVAERALRQHWAETERRRAERELERQRAFADSLLDMVASLVVVIDSQGRIVRFNRACEQISGWSEAEVRGRPLREVVHEAEVAPVPGRTADLSVGTETEWLTRAGGRRLISWVRRAAEDERGGGTCLIGTGTDVTLRRRLEGDLRRAAIEWRDTFDGLPIGVLVVDADGRVLRANRAAMEGSGRASWADVIDRSLASLGPGEPWGALATLAADLREEGDPVPPREVTDALTRRTWVVGGRRLGSIGGTKGPVVLNFQDVTETVRLKDQLRQTETMAEIGSIVAGVAHEVRNPLFSISATLDAFESRFGATEGYQRYLGVLRGEIVRLTLLMTDLLDFGRPSRPDFVTCRLEEVAAAAVVACAATAKLKPVEVITRQAPELPQVAVDRARMTQVLQNLIENAVHFSPPGSRVELGLGTAEEASTRYIEVTVKDSGPGFDPNDLSRLFEPFFTRRRGGTGLGLSIVKRIVYDHGGEVEAHNHPDGGAVVRVRLRVHEQ